MIFKSLPGNVRCRNSRVAIFGGHYIDAHKIVKRDVAKGYLIANNHGFENGWTRTIYGKVVTGEYANRIIYQGE